MIAQLPLGFRLRDDATFDSYLADPNNHVLKQILKMAQGYGEQYIYVWGAQQGIGRTHLLQACCHAAPEFQQTAVYISLDQVKKLPLDVFQGLENLSLVCLDNIEYIVGNKIWEENLFHLFNKLKDNYGRLLIAGNLSPTQLPINLLDLKSRLAWGVSFQLQVLNDDQKLSALQLRARCRGLELDTPVARFLIRRCSRDMNKLFATLEKLDDASLAGQRRLTIPFVKQVLEF